MMKTQRAPLLVGLLALTLNSSVALATASTVDDANRVVGAANAAANAADIGLTATQRALADATTALQLGNAAKATPTKILVDAATKAVPVAVDSVAKAQAGLIVVKAQVATALTNLNTVKVEVATDPSTTASDALNAATNALNYADDVVAATVTTLTSATSALASAQSATTTAAQVLLSHTAATIPTGTFSAPPNSKSATKSKAVTITCVKNKVVKKVTAINAVCPKGFKKK